VNPVKAVGVNAAIVAVLSALAAMGYTDLIAIASGTMVLVGGLGWVLCDAGRTERLVMIIVACRGRPDDRDRDQSGALNPAQDATSGRGGRIRGRSRRGM